MLTMRKFTAILFGFSLMVAGCSSFAASPEPEPTKALIPVRIILSYRPDIQFAPFYVGLERGHFQAEGIDLSFEHMPETEAVALVGAGEVPFAVVSGEQVLLARAQGLPVVYVMAWYQDYPVAVAAPADGGIEGPQDLAGKQIGIPGLFGASYIGYRALLMASELPEDAAYLDSIGYNQVEALLEGREDAIVIYANNEPWQLEAQGLPTTIIKVADYVSLTSNGLITNENLISEDPELVAAMVKATLRAIGAAEDDPDYSFEVSKKYVTGLSLANEQVQRRILKESIAFWKADRLGYSDPESWANMRDVLLEMGLLTKPLDLTRAYTNEFIP